MLTLITWIILTIIPWYTPHQSMQQMIDSGHTLYISDSAYCGWKKLILAHSRTKAGQYIKQLRERDIIKLSNSCTYQIQTIRKVKLKNYNTSIFNKQTLFLQTSDIKWRVRIKKTTLVSDT